MLSGFRCTCQITVRAQLRTIFLKYILGKTSLWRAAALGSVVQHTFGGNVAALKHSLLPWEHRPSARAPSASFQLAKAWALLPSEKLAESHFSISFTTSHPFLNAPFVFLQVFPAGSVGGGIPLATWLFPAGSKSQVTPLGALEMCSQQTLRVRAHLQIFSCNAVLLELLLAISSIRKRTAKSDLDRSY